MKIIYFILSVILLTGCAGKEAMNRKDIAEIQKAFRRAVESSDVEEAKLLLKSGVDINDKDDCCGNTALHIAAQCGHVNMVRFLLDRGANVNAVNHYGQTSLHRACCEHIDVVKILINADAALECEDDNGCTPLYWAIEGCKSADIAELLIAKGADVNVQDNYGVSLLQCAMDDSKKAILLLKNGATLYSKDECGNTPLHDALPTNDRGYIQLLIDMNADLNSRNNEGETPLDEAIIYGYPDIIVLLRRHDAQTSRIPENLLEAVSFGDIDRVRELIIAGENVNTTSQSCEHTPLLEAVFCGYLEISKLLIDNGADVNAWELLDEPMRTPLHLAVEQGYVEIVRFLISRHADLEAQNSFSHGTPLHKAVLCGRKEIVQVLLSKDANVNAMSLQDGTTPLDVAKEEGYQELCELFIDRGAKTGRELEEEGK